MIETPFGEAAARLRTVRFGKNTLSLESVGSTNVLAWEKAEKGAAEGTVVIAEEQTAGRGRLSRRWYSPSGLGIWMSVVLRPPIRPEDAPGITLCASVAVAQALRSLCPVTVTLKWPNDVMVQGRKLCGILTEMKAAHGEIEFVICGVGINVNQAPEDFSPDIRDTATSILMATGSAADRTALFAGVLEHLEKVYDKFCREGVSSFIAEWRSMCPHLGRMVRMRVGEEVTEGVFSGIEETGALVLRLDSGVHRSFLAGDVELIS